MPETGIVQGTIKVIGTVHGAMNTIVTMYEKPDDWFFKQFVTEQELQTYAREYSLAITKE